MIRLTRDRTAEPVSRDQILRREREQRSIIFPLYSADHEQDWQPHRVDPNSAVSDDDTYIQVNQEWATYCGFIKCHVGGDGREAPSYSYRLSLEK